MKFTFCKETKITKDGIETLYFTRDHIGDLVSGSCSFDKDKAESFFDIFVKTKGSTVKEEVLKQVEIG